MFKNLLSIIIFVILFISFYQEEKLVFELCFTENNISAISNVIYPTSNNYTREKEEDIYINSEIDEMLLSYNVSINRNVRINDTMNVIIPNNISIDSIKSCLSVICVISVLKTQKLVIFNENDKDQTSKIKNRNKITIEPKSENEYVNLINDIISSDNITVYICIFIL